MVQIKDPLRKLTNTKPQLTDLLELNKTSKKGQIFEILLILFNLLVCEVWKNKNLVLQVVLFAQLKVQNPNLCN